MKRAPFPPPLPRVDRRYQTQRWTKDEAREFFEYWARCFALFAEQSDSVWEQAAKDRRGVRAAVYDTPGSRTYADDGSVPGPTPGAIHERDESSDAMNRAVRAMNVTYKAGRSISAAFAVVMALDSVEARELLRSETGGADCGSCGRFVAQTPSDRLRSGLCHGCNMAKRRKQGLA